MAVMAKTPAPATRMSSTRKFVYTAYRGNVGAREVTNGRAGRIVDVRTTPRGSNYRADTPKVSVIDQCMGEACGIIKPTQQVGQSRSPSIKYREKQRTERIRQGFDVEAVRGSPYGVARSTEVIKGKYYTTINPYTYAEYEPVNYPKGVNATKTKVSKIPFKNPIKDFGMGPEEYPLDFRERREKGFGGHFFEF